jgi:NADH-quinone oxidoreductase subunit G
MVEIEVDGTKVEVLEGSTVMQATNRLGVYVPHFCYHKKLSIAANCRMCLVEVEKAPKPLPACATPVTAGMKVWTRTEKAIKAQKGVMEFLLINHPLDCPICDQGGECQLQDLAVGYGASGSRYTEEKRVVFHKSIGPLVAAEEMSRCIHCTRCVRFGQEIAGVMELGMSGRGEHSEILSFVGRGVKSELSGNMIDVCPVGALTSKPFRYSARTWELSRRKSVSPHDSLGSNLVVQVKQNTVMRVLPLENEAVNECWLSDRDRFAYEGLNAQDRLLKPMLRQDGQWHEVEWPVALDYAAHALGSVRDAHGAAAIGAIGSPQATVEELHLMGRLIRGLGSQNVDFRPRVADSSLAAGLAGAPWLGMPIEAVNALDRIVLVGSFLRKDHPLLASRVRAAAKRGARIALLHSVDDDLLMPIAAKAIVAPFDWPAVLAGALVAALRSADKPVPAALEGVEPDAAARALAELLSQGSSKAVLLGNAVSQHPQASLIAALAQALSEATGATLGWLGEGANAVGGYLAGAVPGAGGLDAAGMVAGSSLKAYLLLGIEPNLDHGNPGAAMSAMAGAQTVIALTAYRSASLLETADCLLPITPFTETSGTFVNCAGMSQSFNGVVRPAGDARPGWKVLRVLGNLLGMTDFDYDTAEQVRDAVLPADLSAKLSNSTNTALAVLPAHAGKGLQRIAEVPIYSADPIVRRAPSLQMTADAAAPVVGMNAALLADMRLADGDLVRVSQQTVAGNAGEVVLTAKLDAGLANGVVRIAAAHPMTAALGAMIGPVSVERV